jgi:dTDP-4-amino-4,6-dideoxygalactose transaminase
MSLYRGLFGVDETGLTESDRAAAETVALPVNPPLDADDMDVIARALRCAAGLA